MTFQSISMMEGCDSWERRNKKGPNKDLNGPHEEEGRKGMFMDYIFLIIVMNLFILINLMDNTHDLIVKDLRSRESL